jgi:hypothetical protein
MNPSPRPATSQTAHVRRPVLISAQHARAPMPVLIGLGCVLLGLAACGDGTIADLEGRAAAPVLAPISSPPMAESEPLPPMVVLQRSPVAAGTYRIEPGNPTPVPVSNSGVDSSTDPLASVDQTPGPSAGLAKGIATSASERGALGAAVASTLREATAAEAAAARAGGPDPITAATASRQATDASPGQASGWAVVVQPGQASGWAVVVQPGLPGTPGAGVMGGMPSARP